MELRGGRDSYREKITKKNSETRLRGIGTGEELIQLSNFKNSPKGDGPIDPYYYDSELKLSQFEKPEEVKKEVEAFIAGDLRVKTGEPLRKTKYTEKQWTQKLLRYKENTKCLLCDKPADLKGRKSVLQTRRSCYLTQNKTPRAMRFHLQCLRKEKTTEITCSFCDMRIKLPVKDERAKLKMK